MDEEREKGREPVVNSGDSEENRSYGTEMDVTRSEERMDFNEQIRRMDSTSGQRRSATQTGNHGDSCGDARIEVEAKDDNWKSLKKPDEVTEWKMRRSRNELLRIISNGAIAKTRKARLVLTDSLL